MEKKPSKVGDGLPGGGFISEPKQDPAKVLKKKQRQSVEKAFNPEDPVGNAVRSLWKKVRG